jgi:hypothetical protein
MSYRYHEQQPHMGHTPESLQRQVLLWRLLRRRRIRRGIRSCPLRHRLRWRWLHPHSIQLLWSLWPQAFSWPRLHCTSHPIRKHNCRPRSPRKQHGGPRDLLPRPCATRSFPSCLPSVLTTKAVTYTAHEDSRPVQTLVRSRRTRCTGSLPLSARIYGLRTRLSYH